MKTKNFTLIKLNYFILLKCVFAYFVLFLPAQFYNTIKAQSSDKVPSVILFTHHNSKIMQGPNKSADVTSTGFSGTGANIDVTYQRCFWRINPDSSVKYIKGSVVTYFNTIQAGVTAISMDLRSTLIIDSVVFRNVQRTVTRTGNTFSIALGTTLAINTFDSLKVYYKGTPPAAVGAAQGYQTATDATTGQKYTYTLSESYEDRDWWPCKADMKDKIDSMDITVSTRWTGPDTFWAASNGKLVDSVIAGGNRTFTYKTRYPIASYLVSVSVGRYNRYYRNAVNVNGTNTPVVYYLLRGKAAATYTNILTAMDKITAVLTAFNSKFGDYPFKNEKHGFYEGLEGAGGMEHQTFSAIVTTSLTDLSTLAHELTHQWFGDKVTFATWNELWLAEGFARYGEVLAAELVAALGQNPVSLRSGIKMAARNATNSSVGIYIPNANITNSDAIWGSAYGSAVYERGAMTVSMLRALLGDQRFFYACQDYMNDPALAYQSATSNDLKGHMSTRAGYDLTNFFNDWLNTKGNPSYSVVWGVSGNKLSLQLTQSLSGTPGGFTHFNMPVVLQIKNTSNVIMDTLVLFHENGFIRVAGNGISGTAIAGNNIAINLPYTPSSAAGGVLFDADSVTIATGTTSYSAGLNSSNFVILNTDIINFKGSTDNNINNLQLTVNTTNKNLSAIIEKSTNGNLFYPIGTMQPTSTNSQIVQYKYADFIAATDNAILYYRAKLLTMDEGIKYSPIVKIERKNTQQAILVSPNPATNYLTIKIPAGSVYKKLTITLNDVNGKIVLRENSINSNKTVVNVKHINAGLYWLNISDGKALITKEKIVIIK